MGTFFHSDITSRKQMVEYLTTRDTSDGYEVLDHSVNGNILYALFRHPKGYRFISVFKMSGPSTRERAQGDTAWGYKEICESMGPSFYDCPERLLSQSDVDDTYGWREKCRAARRRKAATKALSQTVRSGTTLKIFTGWAFDPDSHQQEEVLEDVVFDRNWSATFFVGHRPGGQQYRYYWRDVRHPELEQASAA